jgi:hypothetical protein
MTWKDRLYRSLPYVFVILSAAGVAITDELWLAIVALVGMWLLPSPFTGTPNVSRETVEEYVFRTATDTPPVSVSRETIPVPCVVMHGSAEPHVLGCEGWTWESE